MIEFNSPTKILPVKTRLSLVTDIFFTNFLFTSDSDIVNFNSSLEVGSDFLITLRTGEGDDSVFVSELQNLDFTPPGSVIDLGAGDDLLEVSGWDSQSFETPYPVQIAGGDGNDTVTLEGDLNPAIRFNISLGNGDDTLDLQTLNFNGNTNPIEIDGGDGIQDTVKLKGRPSDYGLTSLTNVNFQPVNGSALLTGLGTTYNLTGVETIVFQSPNNTRPVANSDSVSTDQNTPLTITADSLLENDSDPDGNTLSITGFSVDPLAGIAVSFNNGNVVVSPQEDFVGEANFKYTITDGTESSTATVNVIVNSVPGINRPGTNGADNILGTVGKDIINGGNGNDVINGGRGGDIINGGNGNDTLIGDTGNDTVTGGRGNDVFVLAKGAGSDTFTDFRAGTDVIGLSGGLTFSQLTRNGNAIKYEDELLATLMGVETATLTASNFISYTG